MFSLLQLLSYIIILIVPVDAHTCESANVIKHHQHQNIKNIGLDGQQNPSLSWKYHRKNRWFCKARTLMRTVSLN